MKFFDGIEDITAGRVLYGLENIPGTELSTAIARDYPYMQAYDLLCKRVNFEVCLGQFPIAALLVWSWMSGVIKLNPDAVNHATEVSERIYAPDRDISFSDFKYLTELVREHGYATATKILHFSAPHRYPILDSRVRSSYSRIRSHDLSPHEYYDEYMRFTHRLREISTKVSYRMEEVLECGNQNFTLIRLLELGLYYIGGANE